jgi:hypothetical protein
MDVFCDLWLSALHRRDGSLGGYTLGNIGSTVGSLGLRHLSSYPGIYGLAAEMHHRRGASDLSHPIQKRGGTIIGPTTLVPYNYFRKAKRFVWPALNEMVTRWPLPSPRPNPVKARAAP